MPILKEFCLAIAAFVAFLYASHACFGPDERDAVKYSVTSRQSWLGADAVPAERWLAKDLITTGPFWTGTEPAPSERSIRKLRLARSTGRPGVRPVRTR